ncbi:cytidine/deoxycytidylate deaminase family protein [Desulfovibrio sp. OttesenSCG-928-A18]|nr:cytidine/deoxycytidylate deaminase family protein [Desulfovibrio sp. OttesenSCG-928-A18]
MSRMPWPQYFMEITRLVARRSTCTRRQVGAIAVKDKRILATGYNGAPRNMKDCLELGCLRTQLGIPSGQRHELCRGLHAEQNVIVQAAVHGVSLEGADIYCTHQPCLICTKMLINCGVLAVYYAGSYPDDMSQHMFAEAGVALVHLDPDSVDATSSSPCVCGRDNIE